MNKRKEKQNFLKQWLRGEWESENGETNLVG